MTIRGENNQLTDEQRTFIDLIEDILRTAGGLRYQRLVGYDESVGGDDETYAVFVIQTNPIHELVVSVELAAGEFRLHVNDVAFIRKVDDADPARLTKWMDERCRELEQAVNGDLKVETDTFAGRAISILLYAGSDGKWREIAEYDNGWGWLGLLTFLLPFGVSITGSEITVYPNWCASEAGIDDEPE